MSEWQSFFVLRTLLKKTPEGDGHSVLIFRGFGAINLAILPLRNLLGDLGCDGYGWGLGANIFFDQSVEIGMIETVNNVADESGRPVSLIGWGLGGFRWF